MLFPSRVAQNRSIVPPGRALIILFPHYYWPEHSPECRAQEAERLLCWIERLRALQREYDDVLRAVAVWGKR